MSVEDELNWGDDATEEQKQYLLEGLLFEGRVLICKHISTRLSLKGSTITIAEWLGFRIMIERNDPLLEKLSTIPNEDEMIDPNWIEDDDDDHNDLQDLDDSDQTLI